jgi:two-component system, sensor histidine kinase and response regulator
MPHGSTILIVEDDIALINGIKDILEIQHYKVLTANNGYEGLAAIQAAERIPDLIVSDIMMPGMNGYEFFEAVRSNPRWLAIPFIFLTARGEKQDIYLGKLMGAEDYMTKPFNAEDLLVNIEGKLKRRSELDQINNTEVAGIKESILTILNHEFRTPLTYIIAYADMLSQDPGGYSYKELTNFLQVMNAGADRIRKLIENFILLVELETGEGHVHYQTRKTTQYDLAEIINGAIDSITLSASDREKNISVQVHALPDDLPQIELDPDYIQAALRCLIGNGIKFTDESDGVVEVEACPGENGVLRLVVTDYGRGIPEDKRQEIYESFVQIERVKYEDQGAGIGLAIVNHITRLHGGSIDLESEVGRGSRFSINLPPTAA